MGAAAMGDLTTRFLISVSLTLSLTGDLKWPSAPLVKAPWRDFLLLVVRNTPWGRVNVSRAGS
jgi:hypothetical protein